MARQKPNSKLYYYNKYIKPRCKFLLNLFPSEISPQMSIWNRRWRRTHTHKSTSTVHKNSARRNLLHYRELVYLSEETAMNYTRQKSKLNWNQVLKLNSLKLEQRCRLRKCCEATAGHLPTHSLGPATPTNRTAGRLFARRRVDRPSEWYGWLDRARPAGSYGSHARPDRRRRGGEGQTIRRKPRELRISYHHTLPIPPRHWQRWVWLRRLSHTVRKNAARLHRVPPYHSHTASKAAIPKAYSPILSVFFLSRTHVRFEFMFQLSSMGLCLTLCNRCSNAWLLLFQPQLDPGYDEKSNTPKLQLC